VGIKTNGDGSTRGGKSIGTGVAWGNGMTSGSTGNDGAIARADDGGSGITVIDPSTPPKGLGLGMDTCKGDLFHMVLP